MHLSRTAIWLAALLLGSILYCRAFISPFVQDASWNAQYDPISFASTGDWTAPDQLLLTGHDWDLHYFYQAAVQRSLVRDRQLPFWNPWTKGGASLWGNPEVQVPTPMWLVNLVAGPIGGARLQVVLHHWIGLIGVWWLARLLGYSRRAAVLASCTFMMSTWYSLHLAAGHASFWSAAYMPIAVGCLWLARRDLRWALGAAACLALVIFEGGAYVYLIFLVLAGSITIAWAVESRSWRPLAALTLTILFSAALAGVRLAPQTAMMERYPRQTEPVRASYDLLTQDMEAGTRTPRTDETASRPGASTEPTMEMTGVSALVGQLVRILLGRVQEVGKFYYRYQGYGWHEYGAYVGPAALVLLCLGPFVVSRQKSVLWPWYVGGMVCFLTALGNFASFSPWALLHELPFYGHSRVPSRYLIPAVLCIAMAAAATYDALWRRFAGHSRWVRVVFDVALVLACADLALVGGRGFRNDAELTRVAIPPAPTTVTTVMADPHEQTALVIAGYRALNGYDAIPVISHATASGEPGYKGEVYLESPTMNPDDTGAQGQSQGLRYTWSPNKLILQGAPANDGWAVWNMNWAPGWRSDPPGLVQSRRGLLAVALNGHTGPVTLYYVAERLELGLAISLAAFLAAGGWLYLSRLLCVRRASRHAPRRALSLK